MRKNLTVTKQSDYDGFSSFKCDLCCEEFQLAPGDVEEDYVLDIFCPSCGIPSAPSAFYTEDIVNYADALAKQELASMLGDLFKQFDKTFKSSKNVQVKKGKPIITRKPQQLYEKNNLEVIEFTCCSKAAKLSILTVAAGTGPYCPYCGGN